MSRFLSVGPCTAVHLDGSYRNHAGITYDTTPHNPMIIAIDNLEQGWVGVGCTCTPLVLRLALDPRVPSGGPFGANVQCRELRLS